jgi:hypothetical protein
MLRVLYDKRILSVKTGGGITVQTHRVTRLWAYPPVNRCEGSLLTDNVLTKAL